MPRRKRKVAAETPRQTAVSPESPTVPGYPSSNVIATPQTYEGEVRRTLMKLGAADPDLLIRNTGSFVENCKLAGVDAKTCAATIYTGERHQHEIARTVIRENPSPYAASYAASPTRDEWEVVVKRHPGVSVAGITQAAGGRKPSEASHSHIVFGDFYDDERAGALARQLTNAGFIATYGPRRLMAAERSAEEGDPSAMETPPAAAEMAPVVSEAAELAPVVSESKAIPWVKVARDPKVAEANMKLADRVGPIKTPKDVYKLVGPDLEKEDQEVFLVIPLNLRGELKGPPYEVARGQRSRVVVDPADVLRAALDAGAEGYIVVHCHPSGRCKPSRADHDLTATLHAATKPYGKSLVMLDHVVVGKSEFYSITEKKQYKV